MIRILFDISHYQTCYTFHLNNTFQNCDYKLTRENYDFVFANFLLGKDIYGPGKYIFGVFDNREIDETFPVKYNVDDED